MKAGFLYIARGEKYIEEACLSVASLKKHNPDYPAVAYFDKDIKAECFDEVRLLDQPGLSVKEEKPYFLKQTPFEKTVFLDSDTYICGDLSELFTLLDHYALALAHAPYRYTYPLEKVPACFPEFNTGVIVFKSTPDVNALFERWLTTYRELHTKTLNDLSWQNPGTGIRGALTRDQPAFRSEVYGSRIQVATLPPEYNCRFESPGYVHGLVKILHGRNFDLDTIAQEINSRSSCRIFSIDQGQLRVAGISPSAEEPGTKQRILQGLGRLFSKR